MTDLKVYRDSSGLLRAGEPGGSDKVLILETASGKIQAKATPGPSDKTILIDPITSRLKAMVVSQPSQFEDPTTYVLVDPADHISVTPVRCTVTDYQSIDGETYIYKDFGADYFDNFEIHFEFMSTQCSMEGLVDLIILRNELDDCSWQPKDWMGIEIYEEDCLYIKASCCLPSEGNSVHISGASYEGYDDILYYCVFKRITNGAELNIYSDSEHTNLIHTSSFTNAAWDGRKFRYLQLYASSYMPEDWDTISVWVQNVKIVSH